MPQSQADRELVQKLRGQLQECAGWDGDRVSADRKRALDYYFQRARGDEMRGRSNVVSGDISAMVEANLAQMMDSFSGDQIAEFEANGPLDDDQAALETFAVMSGVMRDNNGYGELGTAIKDALLLRNGWIKVWVTEDDFSETLDLENATPETIAGIAENPDVTVEVKAYDGDDKTATVKVTKTLRQFRTEAIDPGNILYPKQWHKTDLQECPFFAERHVEPRSELLRRGFSKRKVNALKAFDSDSKIDTLARDVGQEGSIARALDKSQDLIEWFEIYALVDAGDGTSERKRIGLAGQAHRTILENVAATAVPYATGTAFINPHRLTGISLFDKLRQTQDLNTGLNRALMDNVNTVIKNRTAYLDGKVNTDDLSDGRPNGNIRVRASVGDVNRAITNFVQPDISQGILANLQHQNQVRTELGGASLELASGNMQMAGGRIGSQGVDRAFSVMEQLAAHMTKNIATSLIRNVFLLAHMVMRQFFDAPVPIKVNGRWESPIPSQWQPRTRVTVKIGMSPGERARKVATLGQIVQSQFDLSKQGMDGVLVNIEGFYRGLTDWGRASDIPNPEQYYLDPATPESKQAAEEKRKASEAATAANRALMSQAVGLEQLRTAFEKYKQDQTTEFEYWKETLHAEIEEAKIVGAATADLVKQTKFGDDDNDGTDETKRNGSGETDNSL